MKKIRLTRKAIEGIHNPEHGQVLYRDAVLPGFGLRVGAKSKVFFVEGQVNYRTRRVTIGRADVLGVDDARRMAMETLAEMIRGIDVTAERRKAAADNITLENAFEEFFEARRSLTENSVATYSRSLHLYLRDWKQRPLAEITKQDVLSRHRRIADASGGVTANNVMRHLRSVYNHATATYEELPRNPVEVLSKARAWHPERRRQTLVTVSQLPEWWAAVEAEPALSRDLLILVLFTGMRRNEVVGLRWRDIDLKGKTIHVDRTKNGDPLDLPLSEFLANLLRERKLRCGSSEWVFPGKGASGHIVETKTITARVSERSGVKFTMHDLRRTFITIAESIDIPHYALKRLINHRTSHDVTGGYIVIDVERLREPVERVANRILMLKLSKPWEVTRNEQTQ